MVVADRFEMLAPANAALAMKIPIIHVEGGERSEGAIDDAVRNALTKMAHLHLVTTEAARRRVVAMGEEPWRVHRVGAGSLDHFLLSRLPDARELEVRLGIPEDGALILAAVHPVTLEEDPTRDALALIEALSRRTDPSETIFFAFPNADFTPPGPPLDRTTGPDGLDVRRALVSLFGWITGPEAHPWHDGTHRIFVNTLAFEALPRLAMPLP